MEKNTDTLIGKTLGTCTLERLIGQGGMGAVYLAKQTRPSRQVAIKILQSHAMTDSQVHEEFLARFRREADFIARLEHVNIVAIYDYGEQEDMAYVVMPYLPAGSLSDVLAKRGTLTLQEASNYINQAASALDYAHTHKVIHRDLKPANFLLHSDGRLVLADFGIARMIQENDNTFATTLTSTGMLLGTPQYMAPEVLLGKPIDARTDIYALGIILFQMLTGQVPFKGGTPYAIANQHLQQRPPSAHGINPSIPTAVDAILQKALAKNPDDRYASAGALAQALQQAINAGEQPAKIVEDNIPTVRSSPSFTGIPTVSSSQSSMPPIVATPQYYTPPATSSHYSTPTPVIPSTQPNTPYGTIYPTSQTNRVQPLMLFIGFILVLLLMLGGILVGLQLNKGASGTSGITATSGTNPSTGAHTPQPSNSAPATGITATSQANLGVTPTQQSPLPKGGRLYTAATPGDPCDSNGGHWSDYNSPNMVCQGSGTQISNPNSQSPDLVGTLLTNIPNTTFPSNYVIEVQLQKVGTANADYGIYFRNQPGNQQGVYTFFIHSDGTWSAYIYDNTTGVPTVIAQGSLNGAVRTALVDVVVNASNFSFYINGQLVGRANDGTYPTGTVGIAVDAGGTILANNFTLYAISA